MDRKDLKNLVPKAKTDVFVVEVNPFCIGTNSR
jgi:hypothetical protein